MKEEEFFIAAIQLLQKLIEKESYSGHEEETAKILMDHFLTKNIEIKRLENNIYVFNKYFDFNKKNILLNSHHDTVRPNKGYTRDPFKASIEKDTLFGLGSNDAGGALVSLLSAFLYYYQMPNLKYNIILALSAEEENSGKNGMELLLSALPDIDFGIVGEPTEMQIAIAEKGLLVLDCYATGISGHAAYGNSDNSIYKAMEDISWIKSYSFPKKSEILGEVKMNVTQINAGTQHNVIPSETHFVIDIRVNELYTHSDIIHLLEQNMNSKIVPRSLRLNPSNIDWNHPIVEASKRIGLKTFGSATLSDQALMTFPSIKMGPGKSNRSHSADEYIYLSEINEGISIYIQILNQILI